MRSDAKYQLPDPGQRTRARQELIQRVVFFIGESSLHSQAVRTLVRLGPAGVAEHTASGGV